MARSFAANVYISILYNSSNIRIASDSEELLLLCGPKRQTACIAIPEKENCLFQEDKMYAPSS